MKQNQFQQVTITTKKQFHEDISKWLNLNGALAITIQDAGDEPIYEPPPNTMPLWECINISAIFPIETNINNLINKLNYDFSNEVVEQFSTTILTEDFTNFKYDFDPICFGNKLWVYPYNKHPLHTEQRCYINLEPGLAFGSGEHPTTALCLEWLAENLETGNPTTIIDYGSGSGVLSLAAIKLGVTSAIAVDNDPQAILSTKENARRNNISEQIATFLPSELPFIEADYIVANILANPLMTLAPTIISHLKTGGTLVLSGILNEQTDLVALTYMNYGITLTEITKRGAWIRIVGKK
jgi:ribosomal protein L11 methyltransferase